MDSPFEYSRPVTGRYFYGRRQDVLRIREILGKGGSIALYGTPKCGKATLLAEAFNQMKNSGSVFRSATVELFDVRDFGAFLVRLTDKVAAAYSGNIPDVRERVRQIFEGTEDIPGTDVRFGDSFPVDGKTITAALRLPYILSKESGTNIVIVLNEFQNLRFCEEWEKRFKAMEQVMKAENGNGLCSWVFVGSRLNAMKEIFLYSKYFYRQVETLTPSPIQEKDIVEHIMRGFNASGKVLDRDKIEKTCRLFRGSVGYIHHYISICDHLSKGYIVESVLRQALDQMVSLHTPRFLSIMDDLTSYQISLLKAVTEGCGQFSSAEAIRQYGFNSAANVKRLKDALLKKEIITFGSDGQAVVADPLFEYWVKKYFFRQGIAIQ